MGRTGFVWRIPASRASDDVVGHREDLGGQRKLRSRCGDDLHAGGAQRLDAVARIFGAPGVSVEDLTRTIPNVIVIVNAGQASEATANLGTCAAVRSTRERPKPTCRVIDSSMARLLADSRPNRPPVRGIGAARHALGVQPALLQGTGRSSSGSRFVQAPHLSRTPAA